MWMRWWKDRRKLRPPIGGGRGASQLPWFLIHLLRAEITYCSNSFHLGSFVYILTPIYIFGRSRNDSENFLTSVSNPALWMNSRHSPAYHSTAGADSTAHTNTQGTAQPRIAQHAQLTGHTFEEQHSTHRAAGPAQGSFCLRSSAPVHYFLPKRL